MIETRNGIRKDVIDVVGIGLGPANLSLAALIDRCQDIQSRFFERRKDFRWHEGLLLPNAMLQVSFLKDLVSLVDPTSSHSFLAFLKHKKRMYAFINANFPRVMRREFEDYLRWVCGNLSQVEFDCNVDAIDSDREGFLVHHRRGEQRARHLVIGVGQRPFIPPCALPHLGSTVIHASEYLFHDVQTAGRRVAVVGGGQTGAEIFLHLLSGGSLPSEVYSVHVRIRKLRTSETPLRSGSTRQPIFGFSRERSISWISRRWNFHSLDEAPFTNELFTPHYSDYFFHLEPRLRQEMLSAQHMASDGISPELLETIYRKLYELQFLRSDVCGWHLRPGRELVSLSSAPHGTELVLHHKQKNAFENVEVDVVILCTGYENSFPSFLEPIKHLIALDSDQFVVREDFSIECDLPSSHRIYVQNGARSQRGIADPNLSLMAWRSAKIINSIVGQSAYDIDEPYSFVDWGVESENLNSLLPQNGSSKATWIQAASGWSEDSPFPSEAVPASADLPSTLQLSGPRNVAGATR